MDDSKTKSEDFPHLSANAMKKGLASYLTSWSTSSFGRVCLFFINTFKIEYEAPRKTSPIPPNIKYFIHLSLVMLVFDYIFQIDLFVKIIE